MVTISNNGNRAKAKLLRQRYRERGTQYQLSFERFRCVLYVLNETVYAVVR